MGNSNGKTPPASLLHSYHPEHWSRSAPTSPGEPSLWHNLLTNETAVSFPVAKLPSRADLPTYQFRAQHPDVVKVHCLAVDDEASMCHQAREAHLLI